MQAIRTDTTNKQTRLHWVIGLFSLLPLAYVTLQAVRAPKLNLLLDYWDVLAKITTDDGSLQPRMLFTYNLEQPFAVPSLLFWADARFFGGDNRVLTVLTVLLMAGIVVLLSRMLPTSLSPVKRAALTVGFAFIMLSTHGIELWVQGTNGISWTPALFFVVLTVFLMHRGRFWPAFAAAVFGCLCFGVGFPAWLGLVLVAWLRREPRWKVLVSAVAGIAVLAIWLTTRPSAPQALATSSFDVQHRLAAISASLGAMWASSESHVATLFAVGVGLLLAILLAVFAVAAVRGRFTPATPEQSDEAGWIGLATCTLALALLIGLGRTTPGINVGMISRYSVIGGLALCSALTLVALRRPRLRARYVLAGVVAVSLVTYATGYPKVATVKTGYYGYGAIEVALRVDAPGALTALQVNPEVVPAARALGMYPLTGSFSLDCHGYELGSQINFGGIKPLPGPHAPGVTKGVLDTPPVRGDALLSGWAVVADTHPDCVLVLDESGKVVGSGITGVSRPDAVRLTGGDANAGWRAVAAPNSTASRIVLVAGGTLYGVDATP
ncbi:MAG: hypothetical protein JWQ81_5388 [Amycolatopsis sp.]|jgi:hypothetical protein|uniref:DUF2079 domain-containing protein n=1 Tax=Amycolatopsis sp. TaxID=37632 RepID=UPI0026383628|nr:DUF2079 domain-containing protein [Amycolatopsis sp.]MCU1684649.1 hypothetical protein [Amycolatopsis sp.]